MPRIRQRRGITMLKRPSSNEDDCMIDLLFGGYDKWYIVYECMEMAALVLLRLLLVEEWAATFHNPCGRTQIHLLLYNGFFPTLECSVAARVLGDSSSGVFCLECHELISIPVRGFIRFPLYSEELWTVHFVWHKHWRNERLEQKSNNPVFPRSWL